MNSTDISIANQKLHAEAKLHARTWIQSEKNLVSTLIRVQETEAYRDFKCKGLFKYCLNHLELTPPAAQMLRTIVNHALAHPELRKALEEEEIPVAYASRIVSSLTSENVVEVLEFAEKHSLRETEAWLVKEQGVSRKHKIEVNSETREIIRDVKNFSGGNPSDSDLIYQVFKEFYERHHPLEKAKRAASNKLKTEEAKLRNAKLREEAASNLSSANSKIDAATARGAGSKKRKPLTAEEKRGVDTRDECRCTYLGPDGKRCSEIRWTQRHHIIQVAHGGNNEIGNIITLCPEHHDLVHQLAFPLEDQREWIPAFAPEGH